MDIIALAKKYNAFQQDRGQKDDIDFDAMIAALFSESLTKTANGTCLVSERSALKDQLLAVRQMAGKWTIDVKEIAPLQDSNRCFLRYHLLSEKAGNFDVMATLRMNNAGVIEEIDEIYYSF